MTAARGSLRRRVLPALLAGAVVAGLASCGQPVVPAAPSGPAAPPGAVPPAPGPGGLAPPVPTPPGGTGPAPARFAPPAPAPPRLAGGPSASPGCLVGDPARLTGTLRSGRLVRTYQVHLPRGYDPRRPYPVILAFHGRSQQAAWIRGYSGLDAADAVVLYPQGRTVRGPTGSNAWEGTRDLPVDGVDVAFTRGLLAEVGRHACIDPRRVLATGASQGGGFAHVLACEAPGTLAAIAPVAGAFYRPNAGGVRACRSGPLPVLEFHGDRDPVMVYTGTRRSRSVPEWLGEWSRRNGCASNPATRRIPPDVDEQSWNRCAPGAAVRHFRILGGNHGWPGGSSAAIVGPGTRTSTISATAVMLDFFGVRRTPPPAAPSGPG